MTTVIGLIGHKGAGKSTAAKLIGELMQCEPIIMPFAKRLKMALEALGLPPESIYGTQAQKEAPLEILGGRSGRDVAQTLGTEWGRDLVHPDVWVNLWSRDVDAVIASPSYSAKLIVSDDTRFQNEAQRIADGYGGFTIRIIGKGSSDNHRSETEQNRIAADYNVVNTYGLDDLRASLRNVLYTEGVLSRPKPFWPAAHSMGASA